LLDEYNLYDLGYVYSVSSTVLDNIEPGDTLIEKNQLKESETKNQLKNFFFKKWTKQKEKGEAPRFSTKEINSLGFSKLKNEIILFYCQFMGLDPNDTNRRTEVIKNYLLNNTFNEKDIPIVTEWMNQGKMKFKINSVKFIELKDALIDIDVDFTILSGSFYDEEQGTTMNFSSDEGLPFDDMMESFEFNDQITEIIQNFIGDSLENFGFDLNKDFYGINVNWI